MTKISATATADAPRSPTPWPRGNPRQPVLDRLDEFEKHLDLLMGQLSQKMHQLGSELDAELGRSTLRPPAADARLPLSDIVFTVYVTACMTLTTVLSVAFLLR